MNPLRRWLGIAIVSGVMLIARWGVAPARALAMQSPTDDQAVVEDIQARLFDDAVLKTLDIRVFCKDGVVTLSGSVDTELEKAAVERIAKQEPEVKRVIDNMTVVKSGGGSATNGPGDSGAPAADNAAGADNAAPPADANSAPTANAAPAAANAAPAAGAPDAPPADPSVPITIPSGTAVKIRMIDGVDSSTNRVGDSFHASLEEPVVANGVQIVPKGADAYAKLVRVQQNGKISGAGRLSLELTGIHVRGQLVMVNSTTFDAVGKGRGKQSAETIGGGAAGGAAIGGMVGGGVGAAIGSGIGAAGGTITQVIRKRDQIRVPSETVLEFKLQEDVNVPAANAAQAPAAPVPAPAQPTAPAPGQPAAPDQAAPAPAQPAPPDAKPPDATPPPAPADNGGNGA